MDFKHDMQKAFTKPDFRIVDDHINKVPQETSAYDLGIAFEEIGLDVKRTIFDQNFKNDSDEKFKLQAGVEELDRPQNLEKFEHTPLKKR